jgi:hypothetical protein
VRQQLATDPIALPEVVGLAEDAAFSDRSGQILLAPDRVLEVPLVLQELKGHDLCGHLVGPVAPLAAREYVCRFMPCLPHDLVSVGALNEQDLRA